MVCVGVAKEVAGMRMTLEYLYYDNITPNEQRMTPDSEMKKAVDHVTNYEKQLMEWLEQTEKRRLPNSFGHSMKSTALQQLRISSWAPGRVSG